MKRYMFLPVLVLAMFSCTKQYGDNENGNDESKNQIIEWTRNKTTINEFYYDYHYSPDFDKKAYSSYTRGVYRYNETKPVFG